jgi:hypothetical protein
VLALDNFEGDLGRGLARGAIGFGGIEFHLAGDAEACGRMAPAAEPVRPHVAPVNTVGPKFAAGCRLELLPASQRGTEGPARISWKWQHGQGELLTRFGGATLRREEGGWVARAWLAADPRAAHFVLSGLNALLVHQQGGTLLHAASVVLGPGVVAFVGPSGAGKSTACGQVAGAAGFSLDRLAVFPSPSFGAARAGAGTATSWLSHPLPGGTVSLPDMPMAAPRWLPLLGVLRVFQHRGSSFIEPCASASAVATLRESAFQAGVGPGPEDELLTTLERLARAVPVGRLHQSLGASSEPLLRRWLLDQARKR